MSSTDVQPTHYDWGIASLVTQLRELREHSLEARQRKHRPPKLPSRQELQSIVENLGAVLFPNRLGLPDINDEGLDYYVGHTLETTLRALCRQIRRELRFISEPEITDQSVEQRAIELTRQFATQLPAIRSLLDTDLEAAYEGDPAARTPDEVLICYPGIVAILHYRVAHILYQLGVFMTARLITELAHSATGIDIHPGAKIGKSFFIDHGTGVVIGETCIIGKHVRIYQAVTLGAKRFLKAEDGSLVKNHPRHPIVEDNVIIYAGATILGRITIGQGSTIGGNVWLTHSVSPDSHITQASFHSNHLISVPELNAINYK